MIAMCANVSILPDELDEIARAIGNYHPVVLRMREAFESHADPLHNAYRAAAETYGVEGGLEIIPNAIVSLGEDEGAYVMAWLWVPRSEIAEDEQ